MLSPSNQTDRKRIFSFAQLTVSDDDDDASHQGNDSPSVTPHALQEHAAQTQRELEAHRQRLRQRSAANLEAERHRATKGNDLQSVISKLMKELSASQDALQNETLRRSEIERKYRSLDEDYQSALSELKSLRRREVLGGSGKHASSPVASPVTSGAPMIRIESAFGTVKSPMSFRLVKKTTAPDTNSPGICSIVASETFTRSALSESWILSSQHLRDLWKTLISCQRREESTKKATMLSNMEALIVIENLERKALSANEAKMRYKALLKRKCESHALAMRAPSTTARTLAAELAEVESCAPSTPVPIPLSKPQLPPPWYPAGTSSINYHSPHRRAPSASRATTPTRTGSVASPGDQQHGAVGERSQHTYRRSPAREPSPSLVPPPLPHHSHSRNSPSPSATRHRAATATSSTSSTSTRSVKRTIETMEALLAELQEWKNVK